jgi:hypothetical protein
MSFILTLLLLWPYFPGQLLVNSADPLYPPNADRGGTAVFAVHFRSGAVDDVTCLSGQEPFSSSGQQALRQWTFAPDATGKTLVMVCYRRPELFAVGSPKQELTPSKSEAELPFPTVVLEPAYPPNTTAQGAVVLRFEVAQNGSIGRLKVIKNLGELTNASVQALRGCRFIPARDRKGNPVSSEAYAVFVFRPPLLVPVQIKP